MRSKGLESVFLIDLQTLGDVFWKQMTDVLIHNAQARKCIRDGIIPENPEEADKPCDVSESKTDE